MVDGNSGCVDGEVIRGSIVGNAARQVIQRPGVLAGDDPYGVLEVGRGKGLLNVAPSNVKGVPTRSRT